VTKLLVIGLGGFLGAVARYGLSTFANRMHGGPFPVGTLLVNVLGCLIIGGFVFLVEERSHFSEHTRHFFLIGVLGSLTTFSTFGNETIGLLRNHSLAHAFGNVLANLALCLAAVLLGRAVVRWVVTT